MSDTEPVDADEENAEEETEAPGKMGFLDHIEELRWSLLKPLIVFVITFALVIAFISDVKDLLLYPLYKTFTEEDMAAFQGLATRNPTGVFAAMMQIGLIVGIGVASPFLIYYIGKFLTPALTWKEKKILIPGSFGVFFLFIFGCSFAFFFLIPEAIDITMKFNLMLGFQMIWSPESYFAFVTWIVLGLGIAFQFPLIAIVLVYLDIVTVKKLRELRRICYLVFFIVAALLTPPDPVTQLMMALPMIVLYEISIVVAAIMMNRKRKKDEAAERKFDEEG